MSNGDPIISDIGVYLITALSWYKGDDFPMKKSKQQDDKKKTQVLPQIILRCLYYEGDMGIWD